MTQVLHWNLYSCFSPPKRTDKVLRSITIRFLVFHCTDTHLHVFSVDLVLSVVHNKQRTFLTPKTNVSDILDRSSEQNCPSVVSPSRTTSYSPQKTSRWWTPFTPHTSFSTVGSVGERPGVIVSCIGTDIFTGVVRCCN